MVLVFHDVTEKRKAEEALSAASRSKDEFLAVLGHELRNPIAPILTAVELLRKKGPPSPELQRLRDVIHRQATQLTRLVEGLLDIGRIVSGKRSEDESRSPSRPRATEPSFACATTASEFRPTCSSESSRGSSRLIRPRIAVEEGLASAWRS